MGPFRLAVIIIFLLTASTATAQVNEPDTSDPNFFLRKELAFRFYAHTSGFGVGFTKAYHPTVFRKKIFEAEILNMKDLKEIRTVYPFADNSKSYVYGKMNYLFLVRAGYGYEKLINRKPYWGGVEVRYLYHAGLSLGFAKPIYLYIINYSPSDDYNLTTERFDPANHFYDNIWGRAPFNYGMDEIKIHPGIYGKFGFQFDFGVDNDRVKALETGIVVDAYPDGVKIMAFNDPKNLFITFYLSLNLGKRYNRNPDLMGKEVEQ
ncbi:MAG: hypothetical protein AB9842_06815 [Bacteroidales bacterium]